MKEDVAEAARLIDWGLRARERPASHDEYSRLVSRYEQDAEFAQLVAGVCQGLNLRVLNVGMTGAVITPLEGSAFAARPADYRNLRNVEDRMLDGLIQVAIAATIFPRAADLEEDATAVRAPTTAAEIEATLRSMADRYRTRSADQPDPSSDAEREGLVEAWRAYERRHPTRETPDGRAVARDSLRIIGTNLERLTDLGCFVRHGEGDDAQFTPTWRYQVLVKEYAATKLYAVLQDALGSGS